MKFERKHKNIIVAAIAVFFVVYGFLDMKFNFNVSAELENNATWILTIIAVALLFSGTNPKLGNPNSSDDNSTQDNLADNKETSLADDKDDSSVSNDESGLVEEKTATEDNSNESNANIENQIDSEKNEVNQ